ncbi:VOC family protein [Dactylosporangium sp. NPDC051485]|uniref:VOC family protein n=1 Tax=Dactylosporangium sp. NPDC051485 TaxID=3154846 RepID=UPI00341C14CD
MIGSFLAFCGLGMTNNLVIALGVIVAAAGPVMIMVLNSRNKVRLYVQGTAQVEDVTPRPTSEGRTARARLKLTIKATGIRGVTVTGTDPAIPLEKWPEPGAVLPVRVLKGAPRKFTVLWDRVQTYQEVMAEDLHESPFDGADETGYSADGDDYYRPPAQGTRVPPDDTPTLPNLPPIDDGLDEPVGAHSAARTGTAVADAPAEQIPPAARRATRPRPRPRHAGADLAHRPAGPLGATSLAPQSADAYAFTATEPQPQPHEGPDTPEAAVVPEAEAVAETESEASAEARAIPETEAVAETESEASAEARAIPETEAVAETESEASAEARAITETEASAEAQAIPETEAGAAAETEAIAEAEAVPEAKAQFVPTAEEAPEVEEAPKTETTEAASPAEAAAADEPVADVEVDADERPDQAGQTIIGEEDEPIIMRLRSTPRPGGAHRRPSPYPRPSAHDRVRRSRPGHPRPTTEPPDEPPASLLEPAAEPYTDPAAEPYTEPAAEPYTEPYDEPRATYTADYAEPPAATADPEEYTIPEPGPVVIFPESKDIEPAPVLFYPDRESEQPPARLGRPEHPVIEGELADDEPEPDPDLDLWPEPEPRAEIEEPPQPLGSAWGGNGHGPAPVGAGLYSAPPIVRTPPPDPADEDDEPAVTPDPYATEHYLPPEDQLEEQPLAEGAVAEFLEATGPRRPAMPLDEINGVSITLIVSDLQRSRRFYRDTLGLTELDSGETSAVLKTGTARVVLRRVADMPPVDRRVVHLNLDVPDVYEAYERLREQGVDFVHRPRVVPQGEQLELCSATFRDPDGHAIALTRWELRR